MPGEVEKAVNDFTKRNGELKEFSTKQIMLLLHEEQKSEIQKCHKNIAEMNKRIDKHLEWSQTQLKEGMKILNDHDKLFERITNILPRKGFCEEVDTALWPKNQKTLVEKVNEIWHQRRFVIGILIIYSIWKH